MSTTKISAPTAPSLAPLANWFDHDHRAHVVQFYAEDAFLLDSLSRFIGTALGAGDGAMVIATKAHRDELAQRLKARGLDTASAVEQGRYVPLDAAETLSKLMVDGRPDPARFADVIGGAIARAAANAEAEQPRVAAFGEMVALLWAQGKAEAAIQLEKLWNDLAQAHSFSLRCAYPMGSFYRKEHGEPFVKICAEHSGVIPSESYTALISEEERLRSIAQLQQKAHALEAEMALRQSEERFQLLVESVQDYAIFMLDPEGRVSSWNSGAERIKGYAASEIIGEHFSRFYPEEDLRSGKPQRELEIAAEQGRFEDEGWRVRKDGSRFWANLVITALRDRTGRLCGFSKVTRDITERMQAHEALRKSNEELRKEIAERIAAERKLQHSEQSLRELSGQLLRMQDEERRHLGRELHDSVGQYLAVVKMGLDSLKSDAGPNGKEADQQLMECAHLVDQAIKEVRTISYLLYPPMLEEMGLQTAIPWYLEGFAKRSGVQTTLEIPLNFGRLPRDVELAIFRVLQESLTNVHRHSGSPTAQVRLLLQDGAICLEVKDQGKGIPAGILEFTQGVLGTLGVGLRGMNERMRQLGGKLELSSTEEGTTVRATVSCEERASAAGTPA